MTRTLKMLEAVVPEETFTKGNAHVNIQCPKCKNDSFTCQACKSDVINSIVPPLEEREWTTAKLIQEAFERDREGYQKEVGKQFDPRTGQQVPKYEIDFFAMGRRNAIYMKVRECLDSGNPEIELTDEEYEEVLLAVTRMTGVGGGIIRYISPLMLAIHNAQATPEEAEEDNSKQQVEAAPAE